MNELIKLAAHHYQVARDNLAAYDDALERIIRRPEFKAGLSVPLDDGRIVVVVDNFAADNRIFRSHPQRRYDISFAKTPR